MNYKKMLLSIILSTLNIATANEETIQQRILKCRKELRQGNKHSISEAQILITAFRKMTSNAEDYYLAKETIEYLERTSKELEEQLKEITIS